MSDDVRDVFVGTGAFVGRIESDTRCAFWATDPDDPEGGYVAGKLVEIDLAMSNTAIMLGKVRGEIEYDAGKSTLGPRWPRGPQYIGRLYLYDRFLATLPADKRPPNPPIGSSGRFYEFQLVVYKTGTKDPRAGRRYQGVHAEVICRHGTRLELDVFDPGRSKAHDVERKRLSIDVASLDTCDPVDPGEPKLSSNSAGTEGQIFIAENRINEIFRSHPKLPPQLGTLVQ